MKNPFGRLFLIASKTLCMNKTAKSAASGYLTYVGDVPGLALLPSDCLSERLEVSLVSMRVAEFL